MNDLLNRYPVTLLNIVARIGLALAAVLVPARASEAPDAQTWYLAFPEDGTCPDFDLVSLQLTQSSRPSLPPLAELAARPGTQPALGIMTVVVANAAEALVTYLDSHPGRRAELYDLLTGDNLAMDDCRLIHPVPAAQGRPLRRTLQFTYSNLTITRADL